MPDWSNLRIELLELIAEKLIPNFVDVIRFRAVCKSWGSISLRKPPNPIPLLPWLMLSSDDDNTVGCSRYEMIPTRFRFLSLFDNKVYSIPISESFRTCCYRSSHGWLFMVDKDKNCSLFNPLTGVRLLLPSISSLLQLIRSFYPRNRRLIRSIEDHRKSCVGKVALSSTPNSNPDQVSLFMVIFGCYARLALFKLGDNNWILVKNPLSQRLQDVICFKGNFYAVDCYGRVVVCELDGPEPLAIEIKAQEPSRAVQNYLVESSGELLLVRRSQGRNSVLFTVFREDPIRKEWIEVESLCGHSLFLGYNHSLSLLASQFYECKENCIYFTDNSFIDSDFPHDVGIYHLADGHIEPLPGYDLYSQILAQPPIWITPSPW